VFLSRFFESQRLETGFYVDVGAHHPTRYSNTFLCYQRGWRGVNVEPTPGSKKMFDDARPGDLNIECAVGKRETLVFHIFNEGALNTFSERKAEEVCGNPQYKITDRLAMGKIPLHDLLDEYLPAGKHIDILNIDAEDLDLEVAESNDWAKYRPTVVLLENHYRKGEVGRAPILDFMAERNYRPAFRTVNTEFFVNREEIKG
jgi:hypothetical protein